MNEKSSRILRRIPLLMVLAALCLTVVLLVLRVLLTPQLRDAETGHFAANIPALITLFCGMVLLLIGAVCLPRERVDVPSSQALSVSGVAVIIGGALGLSSAYDAVRWLFSGVMPPPEQAQDSMLTGVVLLGMVTFGVLGGVALVLFGLRVAARGGTYSGMSGLSMLAPVMWAWCRLAWYEISYATTVGWSNKVYDFLMVIVELLFLFKLARLASGVGKASVGSLLFYALGVAALSLSGVLTQVCLSFVADVEAYRVGVLAGAVDVALGLFALVLAWGFVCGCRTLPMAVAEALSEDDHPYNSSEDALIVSSDEAVEIEETLYDADIGSLIFEEADEDEQNSGA